MTMTKSLDQYFSCIGQGFDYLLEKNVENSGGLINAALKMGENTSIMWV